MNNVEASNKKPRCQHISKIGARCQADPQTGKDYCFFHDPEQKSKQAAARKQGGEVRSRNTEPKITLPPNLAAIPLQKPSDVYELLSQTVNNFRRGEMDLPAIKTITYLAAILLRALKTNIQPDVAELLADTINQFRCGQLELRAAKAIGNIASLMLNVLKLDAMQKRETAEAEATRAAEAIGRAQSTSSITSAPTEAPRYDNMDDTRADNTRAVTTPTVPVKPLEDHDLYPTAVTIATVNTATHQARDRKAHV